MEIWIAVTFVIAVLFTLLVIFIYNKIHGVKESSIMLRFITFGMAIIGTGALSCSETILNIYYASLGLNDKIIEPGIASVNIIIGIVFIFLGFKSKNYLNDKYYILNIHGESKVRVHTSKNIKNLGLVDFKVREREVNFINYFNRGENIECVNTAIIEDLESQVIEFVHESKDYKKALAALGPIPYTVYAGTMASGVEIDDYIDFDKINGKYKYLNDESEFEVMQTQRLNGNVTSDEALIVVSTTTRVKGSQITQFENMEIWELFIENTGDNSINGNNQAQAYVENIMQCIDTVISEREELRRINLVMATQPILSFKLGQRFSLNKNRLPSIAVYHFKSDSDVCYPFGIVVTEKRKGNLIMGRPTM